MKKEIVFMALVFFIAITSAMEEPIIVRTLEGDYVKLYAWVADGGPLITMNEGVAEDGTFTTTFYSVNSPTARFQVIILRNNEKIRDEKFDNQGTNQSLLINCIPKKCSISVYNKEEPLNNEEQETTEEQDEIIKELEQENTLKNLREYVQPRLKPVIAISVSFVLFLFLVIILIVFLVRKKVKNKEDEELRELEEKLKEKKEELRQLKEGKLKREKIKKVKEELAEKEREIIKEKKLRRERIEQVKRELSEKEKEIDELKEPDKEDIY